ncbi:MAG: outer membrane protein [Methyloprofundus sp.]|nr:MAG: outer membrane protein [Methyloprofundus sp.]
MNKKAIALIFLISTTCQAQNLLETYDLALQNDPFLRQAAANKLAIGEKKDQSIARLLPTVTANGSYAYQWQYQESLFNQKFPGQSTRNNYWDGQFTMNLVQPVFHWDQWVQLSQSEKQIAQAEASYVAEQQNLITKTTSAYFAVLAAQDDLAFIISEKNAIGRQLEQAKQRFDVGLIAITDVYEAQAGYDQSRSDEIAAVNAVDNAEEALMEIIGPYSAKLATLGETLPLTQPVPASLEEWNNSALVQNLQILIAKSETEILQDTIELQRSGHYPQLDIVSHVGFNDNSGNSWSHGNTQSVGMQLNIPIFEGGAVNSRTREAEYQLAQANENLIATQRAATKEVKNAYRGVMASISQVQALNAAVISGQSALEATDAGFEVGTRTMVDVLAATRNLTSAKSKYAQARYQFLISGIRLKNVTNSLSRADLEAINRYLN